MSAEDSKTIDLIIQAAVKGGRSLTDVAKSIADIEKALDGQSEAAKKGRISLDDLLKVEQALLAAQADLKNQGDLVSTYKKLSAAVEATTIKVQGQISRYDDYKAKLDAAGTATEFQTKKLEGYGKALSSSQSLLTKHKADQESLGATLKAAGINLADLSNEQLRLNQTSVQFGAGLAQTRATIEQYTVDIARASAEEKAWAENQAFEKKRQATLNLFKEAELAKTFAPVLDSHDQADRQRQLNAEVAKAHDEALVQDRVFNEKRQAAEEKAWAENLAFERKRQANLNEFKAAEFTKLFTPVLDSADQADQQLKINTALRETADAAIAAARGYKTLGTASKTLSSSSGGLREVINGILDPAAQARTTLAGVEAEVQRVGAAVSAIRGPISGYREQVQQLVAAQKAIANQASLVDQFSRQVAAVRQARAEFVTARTNVLQYAEALRNSGGANDQLEVSLRAAQTTLAATRSNLQAQVSSAQQLRGAMRDAGLATNDLTGTQARLTSAAQGSTTAMRGLSEAHQKYGDAVHKAAGAHDIFSNSGRTTLSLLQRIRGEVLSLVAAYAGIYGAISGAGKALDAFKEKQAIQNQLSIAFGNDTAKIGDAYAYVRGQADRIGLDFTKAAGGFAKFAASATLAGRSTDEAKFIFEKFSEVGTVLNLNGEKMELVFKALEQMMSKGKIQAEELTGQLGDSLPGAFGLFQEALKSKFPDLKKAMQDGKVSVTELVTVAEHMGVVFGTRLPQAMKSLQASQNRLNTEIFDFKVMVAEQGFADEYAKLVQTLSEFFRSTDGKKFAKDLSDGLSLVVQALRWMVENLDIVKTTLSVVFGIYLVKFVAGGVIGIGNLTAKILLMNATLEASGGAMAALTKLFFAFQAALVGWEIGTLLNAKFVEVRRFGIALVTGFDEVFTRIKYGFKILFNSSLPDILADALAAMGNKLTAFARNVLKLDAAILRATGKGDLADAVEKAASAMEFRTDRMSNSSAELVKQMEADLAKIRDIGFQMWKDAESPGAAAAKPAGAPATPKPKPNPAAKALDDETLKKIASLKQQIEAELVAIDATIDRHEKASLESRLAAIDKTYFTLIRKIEELKALGSKEAAKFSLELQADIELLKLQETAKFNAELTKEQTTLQTKLEQIDAQIGRSSKTDLDARLKAVKDQYEETYREIAAFREKLVDNKRPTAPADLQKSYLDGQIIALQNLTRQKFYEEAVNTVIDERKAKLELIAVEQKTGLITELQAREKASAVIDETQPKIVALVAEGLKFADAMTAAATLNGESVQQWDTLKAKLLELQASADGLKTKLFSAAQINEMLANGATDAFGKAGEAIVGAIRGVNSWNDAIALTGKAFGDFAEQFLIDIAKMILKTMILKELQQSFGDAKGGLGGLIADGLNAMVHHDGGVVGGSGTPRTVSPAWFANAPRYHGGGIAGLAPNEFPAILKKNEEVLRTSDPRNVRNGGTAGGIGAVQLTVHPDALHLTLRDWFEGELSRISATR